uniref:Uncharacterized protein n=1 Tax=Cannabis sativa TaxID=3483 RepID=A0A803PYB8_CANSA
MVVQTRRGVVDQVDPLVADPTLQTPRNARIPPVTNSEQPNTQPRTVGQGLTSPLVGITLGVQETGNTSSVVELGAPNTGIPSATNVQTTIGDDTEI